MIGVQCHWSFVEDILGYLKIIFDNFCDWHFLEKLAVKLKFFGWVVHKACIYRMKGWWQGFIVNWSFVGDILGYLNFFLRLTVLWKNWPKTQISKFFHDLWSHLKVSEMDWEVKKIIRGQTKHCLWDSNAKTRKFLPQGLSGSNLLHCFRNQTSPVAPSGSFEPFWQGGLGQGLEAVIGGRATAQKINLPKTCSIWASYGLFESHWSTYYEYINFLFLWYIGRDIYEIRLQIAVLGMLQGKGWGHVPGCGSM